MEPSFEYRVEDGVAVLTFDIKGESVNTLSPEVGREFNGVLDRAMAAPEVKAVVFISGKKDSFIVGAKIDFLETIKSREEAETASRAGQEGFNQLAANPPAANAAKLHGATP